MATSNDEIIIDVEVEGNEEVIASTKSIQELTKANKELREERNKIIPVNDKARAQIVQLNKQIDANTNAIKKNSSTLEQQRFNVGNYKGALDKLIPGLGATAEGFTAMLSPMTAAAAGFGALIALYAKSAAGANDAAKANDTLTATLAILSNELGNTVGDLGLFEKLADFASVALLKLTSASQADFVQRVANLAIAKAGQQALRDEEIAYIDAAAAFKKREKEAETARRARDDQERPFTERLLFAAEVNAKLSDSEKERTKVLYEQLETLKSVGRATGTMIGDKVIDLGLRRQIAEKEAQIADIEEEVNGKLTENAMAVRGIVKEEDARLATVEKIAAAEEKARLAISLAAYQVQVDRRQREAEQRSADYHKQVDEYKANVLDPIAHATDEANDNALDRAKKFTDDYARQQADADKKEATRKMQIHQFTNDALLLSDTNLSKKQRGLRTLLNLLFKADKLREIAINTQAAAVAAYQAVVGIYLVGPILAPIAAAAAVAFGLITAAKVSGVSFAQGGDVTGTFKGRRHSQGGEHYVNPRTGHHVEVEDGENWYVLNRRASREINYLNAANTRNGGRSLIGDTSFAADGGRIATANAAARSTVQPTVQQPVVIVTIEQVAAGLELKYQQENRAIVLP